MAYMDGLAGTPLRTAVVATALTAWLGSAAVSQTLAGGSRDDSFACLADAPNIIDARSLVPSHSPGVLKSGGFRTDRNATGVLAIDARNQAWTPAIPAIIYNWITALSRASQELCWAGGLITQSDQQGSTRTGLLIARNARFAATSVDGVRFHGVWSAVEVSESGGRVSVRSNWMSSVRSTCIRLSTMRAGTLEDSLLDRCYVPITVSSVTKGRDRRGDWVLRNNLISVGDHVPQRTPDAELNNLHDLEFQLYNNVFLVEESIPYAVNFMSELIRRTKDCESNVIVWVGEQEYPGTLKECFSVSRDLASWQAARARWIADHPEVARLQTDDLGLPVDDSQPNGPPDQEQPSPDGSSPTAEQPKEPVIDVIVDGNKIDPDAPRSGYPWQDGTFWTDGTGWI